MAAVVVVEDSTSDSELLLFSSATSDMVRLLGSNGSMRKREREREESVGVESDGERDLFWRWRREIVSTATVRLLRKGGRHGDFSPRHLLTYLSNSLRTCLNLRKLSTDRVTSVWSWSWSWSGFSFNRYPGNQLNTHLITAESKSDTSETPARSIFQ